MNKEWFSAIEIAGLPGMPGTDRRVRERAKKYQWVSRKKQAGKGLEYNVKSLPAETKAALIAKHIDAAPVDKIALKEVTDGDIETQKQQAIKLKKQREDGMARFVELPSPKKLRARAREYLVLEAKRYIDASEYKRISGLQSFCDELKRGLIIVPARFKDHLPHLHNHINLHPSTLRDWQHKYETLGIYALVDGYGARRGQSKIERNAELKKLVLGCIFDQPHITAKKIRQYIQATSSALDIVSDKTIERYISNWKNENAQLWTYMTNPDKWKNTFQPAFGTHHDHIDRINQLWELDSTPGDWMLTDGRHSVVGVIDLFTRRMKLLVSKSSTAAAVCQVFRKAVIDWGVPEKIRTDNGKDYVSDQFTTAVRDLEITQELCLPFASEEKGTIERSLQTMSHGILDLLPGFIGHNVAERKVIEARKSFADRIMKSDEVVEVSISSSELQEKLDQWTDHIYMHDAHGGLDGKTPWQVATSWTGTINRISNERALDMLLAEVAGIRTITKKGIALDRHHFIAPELGPLVGNEVKLRRDESDIGQIYVYSLDGEYICRAECPKLLGISPAEAANAAKSTTKKLLAEQRKEMKEVRRSIKGNITEVVIKHRIEQSQNVAALPHKFNEYTTPALQAAGRAADNKYNRQPQQLDSTEQDEQAQQELEAIMQQKAPVVEIADSPEQRYSRAYILERREHLNETDRDWLKAYKDGSEYSAMKDYFEEFGLTPEWSEAQ